MNTGIQDAVNLAWKLALVVHGKSPDSLLNSYNEEREPVAKMVLSLTDRLTRMATLQGALGQQLRNALLPILTGIHLVEDRIAETMAEIGIHYRRSSIVSGKTGHAIHAGDRAPDCEFQLGADRRSLSDYSICSANRFIIFSFLPMRTPISHRHSNALRVEFGRDFKGLIDAFCRDSRDACRFLRCPVRLGWWGARPYEAEPGAIVLIRPDGYIGFRGGARHTEALREHLARIFSRLEFTPATTPVTCRPTFRRSPVRLVRIQMKRFVLLMIAPAFLGCALTPNVNTRKAGRPWNYYGDLGSVYRDQTGGTQSPWFGWIRSNFKEWIRSEFQKTVRTSCIRGIEKSGWFQFDPNILSTRTR